MFEFFMSALFWAIFVLLFFFIGIAAHNWIIIWQEFDKTEKELDKLENQDD